MQLRAEMTTARLALRPVVAADEAAVVAALCRPEVSGWLTRVPSPYRAQDFRNWLAKAEPGKVWAIADAEGLAGIIGLDPHLGYWFAPDRWRRGYATEAGRAVVSSHFADPGADELSSGFLAGNAASQRVLQKLGFVEFGRRDVAQASTGRMRDHIDMVLQRAAYAHANPIRIETPRLVLASPDPERDLGPFLAIMGQHRVARMLGSFPHPLPSDMAHERLLKAQWRGHIGYSLGLYPRATGQLAGTVGLGGDPVSTGFGLAPAYWGKGLMREALAAFLADCCNRFDLHEVHADHFADNAASGRVMRALGFEKIGEALGKSKARLEPAPIIQYRLNRNNLKA